MRVDVYLLLLAVGVLPPMQCELWVGGWGKERWLDCCAMFGALEPCFIWHIRLRDCAWRGNCYSIQYASLHWAMVLDGWCVGVGVLWLWMRLCRVNIFQGIIISPLVALNTISVNLTAKNFSTWTFFHDNRELVIPHYVVVVKEIWSAWLDLRTKFFQTKRMLMIFFSSEGNCWVDVAES